MLKPGSTILLQGDSITDCGRNREDSNVNSISALGLGYAKMVSAQLLAERPADRLKFYNRGIAGDRIVELCKRIKSDVIDLKPDVMSVLIGVNDSWHWVYGPNSGVPVPKFEQAYRDYLNEVREALPEIQFILCEPFVLKCGGVTAEWVADLDLRRAVAKKLAGEFGAVFVPFQEMFDGVLKQAPPEYWAGDGVHPSAAGHHLMAQAWLAAVK